MLQIKRHLLKKLLEWKDDPRKKPIILRGARQVGKSYLARSRMNINHEN
jgi:predicted AAA+ superfamily ATPase